MDLVARKENKEMKVNKDKQGKGVRRAIRAKMRRENEVLLDGKATKETPAIKVNPEVVVPKAPKESKASKALKAKTVKTAKASVANKAKKEI